MGAVPEAMIKMESFEVILLLVKVIVDIFDNVKVLSVEPKEIED